ncbi:hypothetical protein [Patulibacter americanus]|uniref:hypothetical protein n=1 Tax=Patulibacter americanus TaxID=588672 RepID=UPI0012F8EB90|nr:hypothetical protein [Patulibacter americanus]
MHTSDQLDPNYDERFYGSGSVARHTLTRTGKSARSLSVRAVCSDAALSGEVCAPGDYGAAVQVDIHRATVTLEDRDAPTVTSTAGDAVVSPSWAGSAGISVAATDQGGGVYRMGVEIDGEIRAWVPLAAMPCRSSPATDRTFVAPKPCPATVGGTQTISMADLPEGIHSVRVVVEDAAGNQTTAYGPATKTITRSSSPPAGGPTPDDLGPLNGDPAVATARLRASWSGTESTTRTVRFNSRPTLRGQLTTVEGQPIKGAFVRVSMTRAARNSPAFERDSLRTSSTGRFSWKLPKGVSSRSIRLSYHQRVREPKAAATANLRLVVKAGLRLGLNRRTVRRGQSLTLTGTVLGRPMPKIGKVVELQARDRGGKWITFRTVRTNRTGQFKARYRFRNRGPATFEMRARARRSGDYPYATGSSAMRRVRVR